MRAGDHVVEIVGATVKAGLLLLGIVACTGSAAGNGKRNGGATGAAGSGGNATEGGANAGGSLALGGFAGNGTGGRAGSGAIGPGEACATGTVSAALAAANLYIMFDRSNSMMSRWPQVTGALNAFFASKEAAGLGIALHFFPDDRPEKGCNSSGCDAEACAKALVPLGMLSRESAPADAQEQLLIDTTTTTTVANGAEGTPMYPAMDGAYQWALAQHQRAPNQTTAVVLVTDGEPQGCKTDVTSLLQLTSDALAQNGVRTFAIGLTGATQFTVDRIAKAGGTETSIFVDDGSDTQQRLLDALGTVRSKVQDCDFSMPAPMAGKEVDPDLVNVNYTAGGGGKTTLSQVEKGDACGENGGWYYETVDGEKRIALCKSTCDVVTADIQAELEILLGCATVVEVPR